MEFNSNLIHNPNSASAADLVHSHNYAKIQRESSSAINAASYRERKAVERNRRFIKAYHRSTVARQPDFVNSRAESVDASTDAPTRHGAGISGSSPRRESHVGVHRDASSAPATPVASAPKIRREPMTMNQQMNQRFLPSSMRDRY